MTDGETAIEIVAKAMLADELSSGIVGRKRVERDFDDVWQAESLIWLSNARAAIAAYRDAVAGGEEEG